MLKELYIKNVAVIDEAVIEFENPVIGTIVPAPACFAIFPYQFNAVNNELKIIKVIDTPVLAVFLSISK